MTAPETFQLSTEMAEIYEATFVPAFFAQWAPVLVDAVGVTPGQRVLDVACGTGIVARVAATRMNETGVVVGIDVNLGMLAVAARICDDLDWRQGDAAALPVGDDEFDAVFCQMAMMFFPDPVAALREMGRAARPGGSIGVLVPGALEENRPYELFAEIVTRHAGAEARNLVTTYFALGDRSALVDTFIEAGLHVRAATSPVGESRFGSIDELVSIEIDSTPLADRLDPQARERILDDCREALAPWLVEDGSLRFPFTGNLIVAGPPVPVAMS